VKELPKVLIFIDWYLPGFKAGGPISSCVNLVSHLKQEFSFYIVTRDTDYTATIPYDTINHHNWNDVDGAMVYYLSKKELRREKIKTIISEVEPDVIYVNGIYSFYFSIIPLILSRDLGYHKIIVAGRGMLAQSAIKVKGFKKKLFIKLARFFNFYHDITFHATNLKEEADIRAVLGENVEIKVAPNLQEAVDFGSVPKSRLKVAGELKLVSIARISPEKNTIFALELLSLYEGKGSISFDLYGPVYEESYWQECKRVMTHMPTNVSVSYKGSLEKAEVHYTLQKYHALFMPTKGENFGHIILESFQAGCPVIISDQTPWQSLAKEAVGFDISLTDKAGYHVVFDKLSRLDQEGFNHLSENAFKFSLTYCQDDTLLGANKALFRFH
jgi:glycosyltransferase involved in cell wall biosynthesis